MYGRTPDKSVSDKLHLTKVSGAKKGFKQIKKIQGPVQTLSIFLFEKCIFETIILRQSIKCIQALLVNELSNSNTVCTPPQTGFLFTLYATSCISQ